MKSKIEHTPELIDILKLVEYIPIDKGMLIKSIDAKSSLKVIGNGKGKNSSDSHQNEIIDDKTLKALFNESSDGHNKRNNNNKKKRETISFRDIVRLLIKFLKGADIKEAKIALGGRLEELRKIGITYPAQYLLFDFCLAALEGDHLDAKLYLAHGFEILGLSSQFNLLLSAIVFTPLTDDAEVRELLTLLAVICQPVDISIYLDLYGEDFENRYIVFQNELMKLK
jgi:hypothetical protein